MVDDYIYFVKFGKEIYRVNIKVVVILWKIGSEIEIRYEVLLKNMCNKFDIRVLMVEIIFRIVVDEIFSIGINWGWIVVLYCFVVEVVLFCNW